MKSIFHSSKFSSLKPCAGRVNGGIALGCQHIPPGRVKGSSPIFFGGEGMIVTAEYKGFSYTFDPRAQAMKDLGVTEETAENRAALAKKTLEYMKTARCQAHTGAVVRWALEEILKGGDISAEAIFSACRAYSPPSGFRQ
jgi:hypothetical protein